MTNTKRLNIKQIILLILTIAFVWYFVSHYTEIKELFGIVRSGNFYLIFLALITQVLYYLSYTLVYKYAYRVVKIETNTFELFPVMLTSTFLNVVTPSAGISAVALFADHAIKKKNNPAGAFMGPVLAVFSDLIAFFIILSFSLIYLFRVKELATYQLILSGILFIIILALLSLILIGSWKKDVFKNILKIFQQLINKLGLKFSKKEIISKEWLEKLNNYFVETFNLIRGRKKEFLKTIGIAFVAHFLDILSLVFVFLAFGGKFNPEIILAGYSIGILFWIVSIVPQGIGIVEGAMALTFVSLGIPSVLATTAAIVWRGLTFWLPFFTGFILMRRVKSFQMERSIWIEVWSVRVAAVLTALMGILNIISAVTFPLAQRVDRVADRVPADVTHGGHFTTVVAGFALLYLARGLWDRKRMAWLVTVGVLAFSGIGHLIRGRSYEEFILSFAIMALLIYWRNHFHTLSNPPSVKQGIKNLLVAFVFTIVYGTMGFYFLDFEHKIHFGLLDALRQVLIMFFQLYNPGLEPITGFGRHFANSIYTVATVTMGYALITILKPFLNLPRPTDEEYKKAKNIVETYGRSTLARFAIFDDKLFFFTKKSSLISYVVKGNIALVLGDPIGPEEDLGSAIKEFKDYCDYKKWIPAFYQTEDYTVKKYEKKGFKGIGIGQEAIVALNNFSVEGKEGKNFRNNVNKFLREGYTFEMLLPPVQPEMLRELQIVSDEWLTSMHGREKKYSLGWFEDDYIMECKVGLIRSANGHVIAFANLIPEYQKNELTVDLMRKIIEAPSGTMDFLFTNILLWGKENNYPTFNFGLSPLYGIGTKSDDPIIEKFLGTIYKHFNSFYSFQGLEFFKAKYKPSWSPRYLMYSRIRNLPVISASIIRADSGDDFILDYVRDIFSRIFRK